MSEAYCKDGYWIIIKSDIITVEWDDGAYQHIAYSEEAAEAIRNGEDPVADGWEDGNGNPVCRNCAKKE